MSYYGSLDTKIQKFMRNTSRDIIRYFSTVDSEDPIQSNYYFYLCCSYLLNKNDKKPRHYKWDISYKERYFVNLQWSTTGLSYGYDTYIYTYGCTGRIIFDTSIICHISPWHEYCPSNTILILNYILST